MVSTGAKFVIGTPTVRRKRDYLLEPSTKRHEFHCRSK